MPSSLSGVWFPDPVGCRYPLLADRIESSEVDEDDEDSDDELDGSEGVLSFLPCPFLTLRFGEVELERVLYFPLGERCRFPALAFTGGSACLVAVPLGGDVEASVLREGDLPPQDGDRFSSGSELGEYERWFLAQRFSS